MQGGHDFCTSAPLAVGVLVDLGVAVPVPALNDPADPQ